MHTVVPPSVAFSVNEESTGDQRPPAGIHGVGRPASQLGRVNAQTAMGKGNSDAKRCIQIRII